MLRPIAVNTRRQAFDAVDVKIKVDETSCGEISEERFFCAGEDSRKLRERDGLIPTSEVKSGTPGTNDVAEAAACRDIRRQANFAATRCLRLAKRRPSRFRAELRSSVDSFNQWIRYLLLRQPVRVAVKQNRLDWILHPRGNGWTVKPDDQHGPLILTEVTPFRYFFVREIPKREAFAPNGSSGKRKSLPGMSDVVQAIPICAVLVLPRFAPRDAGQNENYRSRSVDKFLAKLSLGPLFRHVGRGTVM